MPMEVPRLFRDLLVQQACLPAQGCHQETHRAPCHHWIARYHQIRGVSPPLRCPIMSWPYVLQTLNSQLRAVETGLRQAAGRSGSRNTPQHFNAHYVRSGSLEPTILGAICAPTLMRGRSCVRCAARRLLGSMIGKGTKACILERRSLSARVTLKLAGNGVVAGGLPVPMRWVDISGLRQAVFASNLY